ARQDLRDYPWPGNVRELENALERGVILAEGHLIHPDDLGLAPTSPRPHAPSMNTSTSGGSVDKVVEENEDDLSLEDYFQHFVLERHRLLSETELAQKLGISRKNLWERRQRLGIPRKKTARRPS
ncbi:MAG: sigma-54-dependent Fis family transcriptional regulator, partial [Gammaproteobacteria bacterium]|nr:sigma-54-dependent Fis family transcriptional regulator [Gammaproteobacteria bacterium]